MTVRRIVTVLLAATLLVIGGQQFAGAAFQDRTTAVTTSVSTITVEPPTNVKVTTSCTTTTVETKETFQVDPVTGNPIRVNYSRVSSTSPATSNVEGETRVRSDDPATGRWTITHTVKDTELYATATWKKSPSKQITGYRMTAVLYGGSWTYALEDAGPNDTSVTGQYDAEVVDWGARLTMDTVTAYGWTGPSAQSNPVTCNSK